jgi:hypothetical protein
MTKVIFAAALLTSAAWSAQAGFRSAVGWGCYTCGFKNGTGLSGHGLPAAGQVTAVTLPSGDVVALASHIVSNGDVP